MKIVALLTGKGKSTLINKNILPIFGRPLLSYPAKAAKKSKYIGYFYVSSDDGKILDIAGRIGYKKIKRPKYISHINSKHIDVIIHAVDEMKKKDNIFPDVLIVLLTNSVATTTRWIDNCIREILMDKSLSAVVPVCADLDHHPFRAKRINKRGYLESFFDLRGKDISTNRQELEPSYFLCHNFWVLNLKNSVFSKDGEAPWGFMGKRVKPFIVDECCDVHTKKDLIKSEEWVREHLIHDKSYA